MRFKLKKQPKFLYYNIFLIFPARYKGSIYWLEWVTKEYIRFGDEYSSRYSKFGDIVAIGKKAKQFTDQLKR